MKRDMDLFREILLHLERQDGRNRFSFNEVDIDGYEFELVSDHILLLIDSGYVEERNVNLPGLTSYSYARMTMQGFDFLESVRDPEIWRHAKGAVAQAKGFTLEILADVAKGFIKTQIKNISGVEL